MSFSHPLIKKKSNPKACAWAYGMNFFDLDAWRREKSTEEYHYWQSMNENRTSRKLGILPPSFITFYSTTKPFDKSWHVLGLGYNPSINMDKSTMPLWSKYVDKENDMCRHAISILVMVESMLDRVNKLVLQASPVWLVTSPISLTRKYHDS